MYFYTHDMENQNWISTRQSTNLTRRKQKKPVGDILKQTNKKKKKKKKKKNGVLFYFKFFVFSNKTQHTHVPSATNKETIYWKIFLLCDGQLIHPTNKKHIFIYERQGKSERGITFSSIKKKKKKKFYYNLIWFWPSSSRQGRLHNLPCTF